MMRAQAESSSATRLKLLVFVLCGLVFASAQALVLVKHHARAEVSRAHELRDRHGGLKTEWHSLQLERSLLTTHSRIQSIAERELGMSVPPRARVRMVVVDESGS